MSGGRSRREALEWQRVGFVLTIILVFLMGVAFVYSIWRASRMAAIQVAARRRAMLTSRPARYGGADQPSKTPRKSNAIRKWALWAFAWPRKRANTDRTAKSSLLSPQRASTRQKL